MQSEYDYLFKFILVGQTNVGKSCLLLRFLENRFKNQHQATLGVQFGAKTIKVDSRKIKLQVWDTAGQESFRSITRAYFRGSISALMVFDLTSLPSFQALKHWLKQVKNNSHAKIRLCLIGNKSDLKSERQVSSQVVQQFLRTQAIEYYFQTSALSGQNSKQPFKQMSQVILRAIDNDQINPEQDQSFGVKLHPKKMAGLSPIKPQIRDKQPSTQFYQSQGCNC